MPHRFVTDQMLGQARALRKNMTKSEMVVWNIVRAHRLDGLGFRRQVPIGPYIVDFVCHEAKLIVEIDGIHHDDPLIMRADRARESWLLERGYAVLRLTNSEVLADGDRAATRIREQAIGRLGRTPPSQPSPARGEGSTPSPTGTEI